MSDEVTLEPTIEVTLPPDEIVWDVEGSEMELDLIVWPEPFLRYNAAPFTEEQIKSELVRNVTGAMIRAMYRYNGVGLAAEQVGMPQAVIVIDSEYLKTEKKSPKVFYNPVIVGEDGGVVEVEHPGEGCLSTPYGYFQPVPRAKRIELEWLDHKGEFHTAWFDGMESIIIQHETDHLFGTLFVDRLSRLKRDMFKRRARKIRRMIENNYKRRLSELKNAPRTPSFNMERAKKWEIELRRRKTNAQQEATVSVSDTEGTEHSGSDQCLEAGAIAVSAEPNLEV